MATVKMIKGNKYADIFDSPETIAQAEKDGFTRVEAEAVHHAEVEADAEEREEVSSEKKTPNRTKRQ